MRISDWSSDVCSSDLGHDEIYREHGAAPCKDRGAEPEQPNKGIADYFFRPEQCILSAKQEPEAHGGKTDRNDAQHQGHDDPLGQPLRQTRPFGGLDNFGLVIHQAASAPPSTRISAPVM